MFYFIFTVVKLLNPLGRRLSNVPKVTGCEVAKESLELKVLGRVSSADCGEEGVDATSRSAAGWESPGAV